MKYPTPRLCYPIYHLGLLVAFCCLSRRACAENPDSTLKALHRELAMNADTSRIKTLLDLSWHFMRSRPDSALFYAHAALNDTKRIRYARGEAQSENALGVAYVMQANYARAVEHNIKSFNINQKLGNTAYLAAAVNNIANDYYELGDNVNAKKYLDLAIAYSKKYNKPGVTRSATITLGNIFDRMRLDKEAIRTYSQGIALAQKSGDMSDLCYGYRSLGKFYASRGNFAKALPALRKALSNREEWDDYGRLVDHLSLAKTFLEMQALDSGERHIVKARELAKKGNFLLELQESHLLLSRLYEAQKQPWEALQAFKRYNSIGDSILSVRKNQAIQANQIEFETAQKEFQLASLRRDHEWQKKKNILYIILSACGTLAALLIFWVLRHRNKTLAQEATALHIQLANEAERARLEEIRHEQEREQANLEMLMSQLNPHFLFNVLNTISQLTLKDSFKARDCIQQLARVYRYVLENREVNLVALDYELNFAKAYLQLLVTRFGDALRVSCAFEPLDSPRSVPPMTIQMLVENIAKHNIISTAKPVQIRFFMENDYFCVANTRRPKASRPHSFGKGLATIHSRYRFLTDRPVLQEVTDDLFIVKLPMLTCTEVRTLVKQAQPK